MRNQINIDEKLDADTRQTTLCTSKAGEILKS
jgi:hypothetical protein